jgi:lipopolysaccharide export system protein LptA
MTRHMRYFAGLAATVVLVAAAGWAAAAQTGHGAPTQGVANPLQGFSQNSDQPIRITSTSLEVRDKDQRATFIGNVHVVQGDTTMRCKTLVVFYDQDSGPVPAGKAGKSGTSNQQIKRLEAKGGVVVTQNDQTATGDNGEFDMKTNIAILTGNVVVTQGDSVVQGREIDRRHDDGGFAGRGGQVRQGQGRRVVQAQRPAPRSAGNRTGREGNETVGAAEDQLVISNQ